MNVPIINVDDAHKHLLDRDSATAMAEQFQGAIALVNELVNYGTNLMVRSFASSDRDLKAICLLFLQLRQFVMHLDGIAILLKSGSCGTADLQLRSLLETAHTMEWILSADVDEKVNYLYVANLRRRCQWDRVAIPGTRDATRHSMAASQLSLSSQQRQEIADEVTRIDALLAKSPFDVINAKFEQHYSTRGFDKPWYEVYGAPSIRNIADQIGKLKEYTYIYSGLSGVTHERHLEKHLLWER